MKRLLLLTLILSLTGCAAPQTAPQPQPPAVEAIAAVPSDTDAARLGIAAVANIAKSMHATYDFPGYAHTEVTVSAVVGNKLSYCDLVLDNDYFRYLFG